jgi:hypothetical protein
MGFFKADPPPPLPALRRADLAEAVSRLPYRNDGAAAGWVGPELQYLDEQLQQKESVVAVATLAISGKDIRGAIALTERRIFSAFGGRDNRRRPLGGRPSVEVIEIADIDHISGHPYIKTYMETSIMKTNGDRISVLIGPTVDHGTSFISAVEEAVHKAKFR